MRHLVLTVVLVLAAPAAAAQTTGVCGTNELLVNGLTPGGTSCIGPLPLPSGSVLQAEGSSTSFITIYQFSFCSCSACVFGPPFASRASLAGLTCLPVPFTACGGTNQSVDIDAFTAACVPFNIVVPMSVVGTCGAGGVVTNRSFLGPITGLPAGIKMSVQAFILDTTCFSPTWSFSFGGIVKTQAYDLITM